MIKVVAKKFIKKDKITEALKRAKELVELTVAKDEGCIKYEVYQDLKDKSIFTIIEEWEDMDKLNKHMKKEHFKRIVPVIEEFTAKKGDTNIYTKIL
ncbi:antibiotic biosynthesis monooxygenase [Clostridium felsineum]|uniref:putative quinol monooxygenase n=1 Tax=Clostridium felsineum TaxID=36839 RepID=UPI00098CD152|nr:putative quinol monooxygenase [Clostridium felsineum]MCR3757557.1 antibiotic biosynthesis monooxygenase [Clostridium felsineum]URZ03135.1 hypothetical protein CLAUR_031810 [Clostridium felsineum]